MLLPDAYPDELFYSVVARFGDRMGVSHPTALAQLTYGLDRITPTVEFPPRLDRLLSRLLPHTPYTPDALLASQSLFPYYSAFLGAERAQIARAAILRGDAIASFARLSINVLQNPLRLRFCTGCVADDRREGREPYWRRHHHLPGVALCAEHGSPLNEGASVRGDEWAGFVSIERMLATGLAAEPIAVTAPIDIISAIAAASVVLLNRPEPLAGGDLAPAFFARLHEAGWEHGRRIAATKLMAAVTQRLGGDVLAGIGVAHPHYNSRTDARLRGNSTDWLAQCLRVRGNISHPLPYVLLLVGLGIDPASLHKPADADALDGAGGVAARAPVLPGPCGNPVCPAADPPVPRPLPGVDAGTFVTVRCSTCGFTYRQSGAASRPKDKRISAFGPLWDAALRRECENGDATKIGIQERLGLDIYTIKRRALDLGLWHPRWGQQTKVTTRARNEQEWEVKREEGRRRHRARWTDLAKQAPGKGRREIGRLDESTYAFLRTYDSDWLDQATPLMPRTTRGEGKRQGNDAGLAALIREAAEDVQSAKPPRRATRASIARALGMTALRFDRTSLPESAVVLAAAIETRAAFAARRREWAEGEEEGWGDPP